MGAFVASVLHDIRQGARLLRRQPRRHHHRRALARPRDRREQHAVHDGGRVLPASAAGGRRVSSISAAGRDERRRTRSYPDYRDLRDRTQAFSGLVAHLRTTFGVAAARDLVREMRTGVLVSDNFFGVLGVQPARGRLFTAADDRGTGGEPVVVLDHAYWRNAGHR